MAEDDGVREWGVELKEETRRQPSSGYGGGPQHGSSNSNGGNQNNNGDSVNMGGVNVGERSVIWGFGKDC